MYALLTFDDVKKTQLGEILKMKTLCSAFILAPILAAAFLHLITIEIEAIEYMKVHEEYI